MKVRRLANRGKMRLGKRKQRQIIGGLGTTRLSQSNSYKKALFSLHPSLYVADDKLVKKITKTETPMKRRRETKK